MYRKKEACRNFQRGSCQYGERCKFLHVTQQQQQPKSNPFGFGSQAGSQFQHTNEQQPKPNPFGFGVQNSSQTKGASDFGAKYQNQSKPFENKWNRFSPITAPSSTPSRSQQADSQAQVANHKCTDPESCKRLIVEDFEHERPLWKLTCYGHWKYLPCDIAGDISYEELRAVAYDDAKQGLSLQSIVERERNLINSKLMEFEALLRNPYVTASSSIPPGQSTLPGSNPGLSSVTGQSNLPPSVSSFSQLGTPSGTRPSVPSNNSFGQSNSFQIPSQTSGGFGMNSLAFGTGGSFGSKQPMQQFGSASTLNIANFSNSVMSGGSSPFSLSSGAPAQSPSSASNHSTNLFNRSSFDANAVGQAFLNVQPVDVRTKVVAGDASIWLKEWNPGEIPEEAPPDEFINL